MREDKQLGMHVSIRFFLVENVVLGIKIDIYLYTSLDADRLVFVEISKYLLGLLE